MMNNAEYRGMGKSMKGLTSAEAMLQVAELNWKNVPMDMAIVGKTGTRPSRYKSLVRSDNAYELGVATADYKPVQNASIVNAMLEVAKEGEIEITHLGSLDKGRRIFAACKMVGEFGLGESAKSDLLLHAGAGRQEAEEKARLDKVELHGVMSSGHVPGMSFLFTGFAKRLICLNGAMLNQTAKARFAMRHVTDFTPGRRAEFQAVIRGIREEFAKYEISARKLRSANWDGEITRQFVVELLQKPLLDKVIAETGNRMHFGNQLQAAIDATTRTLARFDDKEFNRPVQKVLELVTTQPGANAAPGTAWNAYNAVTYFVDHVRGRADSSAQESSMFGEGASLKQTALDLALAYTGRYNDSVN